MKRDSLKKLFIMVVLCSSVSILYLYTQIHVTATRSSQDGEQKEVKMEIRLPVKELLKRKMNGEEPNEKGEMDAVGITTENSRFTSQQLTTTQQKYCNVITGLEFSGTEREELQKGRLNTRKGKIPIYVYGRNDFVSRSILDFGEFEADKLRTLNTLLENDTDLHLIDIGCSVGVFTLNAAALGRRVVAVDANIETLKRLHKSLVENNFTHLVTIVHNTIYDKRNVLTRVVIPDVNIGGSAVISEEMKNKYFGNESKVSLPHDTDDKPFGDLDDSRNSSENANTFNTTGGGSRESFTMGSPVVSILFDDLLEVIQFKKAILKMDIEGGEYKALRAASDIFNRIKICFIIMEWFRINPKYREGVWNFFKIRGYLPYQDLEMKIPWLDISHLQLDIFWNKENC